MTVATPYTIGSKVLCDDIGGGELRRVVIDPIAMKVTHLVVAPKHRAGPGRLVPVELVAAADSGIVLRCTAAQFDALESADETHFLPGATGYLGYDEQQMLSWPYFNLAGGVSGIGLGTRGRSRTIRRDRVPVGEVEIRRGEGVHATDGQIGHVRGLLIDPRDQQVTHVLLDEGHLWDRREVAIPISSVTGMDDGVRLALTKRDVRELPRVDVAPSG